MRGENTKVNRIMADAQILSLDRVVMKIHCFVSGEIKSTCVVTKLNAVTWWRGYVMSSGMIVHENPDDDVLLELIERWNWHCRLFFENSLYSRGVVHFVAV